MELGKNAAGMMAGGRVFPAPAVLTIRMTTLFCYSGLSLAYMNTDSLARKRREGNEKADTIAFLQGNMPAEGTFHPDIQSIYINTICFMEDSIEHYVADETSGQGEIHFEEEILTCLISLSASRRA
ncbi:MAG: hypothetical protein KJ717_09980 [Proteobacteria bacterium]|nr:hypothetical protein [Pseudomonadota bacterium]